MSKSAGWWCCFVFVLTALGLQLSFKSMTPGPGDGYEPIPESILTPEVVDTRLGKLDFFDGYPSEATVEKVYDRLDFMRGVRAFLDTLPFASLYAMREGFREVGCADGTVGIFEDAADGNPCGANARAALRTFVPQSGWIDHLAELPSPRHGAGKAVGEDRAGNAGGRARRRCPPDCRPWTGECKAAACPPAA